MNSTGSVEIPITYERISTISIIIILLVVAFAGCFENNEEDEGLINVIVTLPPQIEMVEAVGGDKIKVTVMVPTGKSPHSYEPVPSQIKAVANAKAYFKIGTNIEFELNYLDFLVEKNDNMKVFDCSAGITLLEMGEYKHEHGQDTYNFRGARDSDEGMDPHIWLSPSNAKTMVQNIYNGLVQVDLENEKYYKDNMEKYMSDLNELINDTHEKLDQYAKNEFLIYHPSWGYFCFEFNLIQLAIEEEGKQPGPAGVAKIIDQAKEHNITLIFVSPQFDESNAEYIAREIDGKVDTIDPLASNYIENLQLVSNKLIKAFNN